MNTTETNTLNPTPFYQEPTRDEIALAAFLAWERDGRQPGRDLEYWLQAEAELRASRLKKAEAAAAQAALPWPPASRATRVVRKAAAVAGSLATAVKRTTTPKTTKRVSRAA